MQQTQNTVSASLRRIARHRHKIKIYFYQLFCIKDNQYEVKNSLRTLGTSQHAEAIEFPLINAYGSSSVINEVNLIEKQTAVSRQLLEVSDAHIVGPYGLLLNKQRKLLTHRIGGIPRVALHAPYLIWRTLASSFSKSQNHYTKVYTTHCTNSSNYFHWLLEFIAGLMAYEKLLEMTGENIPILLQTPYMSRQKQWLDLIGYPYEEIRGGWKAHLTADLVYFSSNEFDTYCNIDKTTCLWIRNKMLENAKLANLKLNSPKKIFINRADTNKDRGIHNNQEIETELTKMGFVSVTLSDYSANEQVALFHFADVVVGEHGAGLADIIFCENCHIVEIFPHNYHNNDIAVLALHTHNTYTPLFGYSDDHDQYPNKVSLGDLKLSLQSPNK